MCLSENSDGLCVVGGGHYSKGRDGTFQPFLTVLSPSYITPESRNLIVALVPYCASCILWTEICGVSRFHPYLSPPTDPQPVIIRTCCSAVIVGNLTPEC